MRRLLFLIPALAVTAGCAWLNPKADRWIHEYDYGYRDYRMPVDLSAAEYEYIPPMEEPAPVQAQATDAQQPQERFHFWPYPMGRQADELIH